MRKSGPHSQPNRRRYEPTCCMCGRTFAAARPDARTCNASCRSALRRWVKLFGFVPNEPPGRYRWLDSFEGRRAFRTLKDKKTAR